MALYHKEVSQDIYQVNLPLPFALNQVNCYLLRGDEGWTIVDAGLNTPEARQGWQTTFAELGIRAEDIANVILTHTHPDHYGLAGWLQAWCGLPIKMSARENQQAQQVWQQSYSPNGLLGEAMTHYLSAEAVELASTAIHQLREMTLPHPQAIEIIPYQAEVRMGNRTFVALHAPGHSDGQLLFYDAADQLLLCGDQILMRITPNIGLWPMSESDPLGRYFKSLRELGRLAVRLGLPGHGAVITNWVERVAEIEAHHHDRLVKMLAAVNGGGTSLYQICATVFNLDRLGGHEIRFALAETLAHVEYMVAENQLTRDDTWCYYRP